MRRWLTVSGKLEGEYSLGGLVDGLAGIEGYV